MSKIKLDARLSAVASLVRKGSRVADIGTDHGYLLAWLIENGISPCGIAADINKGPLDNAKKTVVESGIADKVELILSNGLQKIAENSCDDIVIAGMGGNLISDILSACPWIYNENLHIVAQPMSHAEVLREFYVKNGFKILEEKTATDGKRIYCIISAVYTGVKEDRPVSYAYLGELTKNSDELTKKYIDKILFALEKKYNALISVGKENETDLGRIIDDIRNKIPEENDGYC
ncbi:MAG: SAM-dependent methyltransferase [Clostridia bacterium]|nr:SAM-dependent methyltransferase [Clostridia bacterium]